MGKQRQSAQVRQDKSFKGRQFAAEVILWARLAEGSVRRSRMEGQGEGVRWYLMFPVSYRDLGFCEQSRQRWRYWQADVVIDMVTTV